MLDEWIIIVIVISLFNAIVISTTIVIIVDEWECMGSDVGWCIGGMWIRQICQWIRVFVDVDIEEQSSRSVVGRRLGGSVFTRILPFMLLLRLPGRTTRLVRQLQFLTESCLLVYQQPWQLSQPRPSVVVVVYDSALDLI